MLANYSQKKKSSKNKRFLMLALSFPDSEFCGLTRFSKLPIQLMVLYRHSAGGNEKKHEKSQS
jgi:hypothetical protein